ncbi:LysR family transcriptional regulator [Brenneria alni]|uniref:LysR family transcriptional regulator n=1 Tax=Brenneria alni TaxID=71656 RepID=A0A421DLX2_9GAMM|nr:LysR family transcriptional regulator [Brenneria alni]RLM21861.1 LysR family transcriptional regulator [Brenneria alni]
MNWTKVPPLYALKAFESAARHQSFTLAASELLISQSAISKHINTMEIFFERKLFYRKGPKIFLTKEGKVLAEDLQYAFGILSRACEKIHHDEHVLNIISPCTFALRQLIPIVKKYKNNSDFPVVNIEAFNDDFSHSIVNLQVYDGVIKYGDGGFSDEWGHTLLSSECLIAVVSPDLLYLFEREAEILIDLVYIKSRELDWFLWCKEAGLKNRFQIVNKYEFGTMDSAISAAIKGLGVAIVDISMVFDEVMKGRLSAPFKCAFYSGKGYYFLNKKNYINDHVLSLLESVKADLSDKNVTNLRCNN